MTLFDGGLLVIVFGLFLGAIGDGKRLMALERRVAALEGRRVEPDSSS